MDREKQEEAPVFTLDIHDSSIGSSSDFEKEEEEDGEGMS